MPIHEPGLDELLRAQPGRRPAAVHHRLSPRPPTSATCTSSASAPRSAPTAWAPTCRYVEARGHQPGPAPDPQGADRRQVHRAGRHRRVGRAAGRQARPGRPRRRGGVEPGVPAGGLRRRGRAAPQPDRLRRQERVGQRACCYAAHKGVFDLAATEDREVPVVVTDFATAELVKVAANAFLATKISFINAMAEVCEAAGADVTQLARAIGYDPRIGNRFLQAGIGFGGACLPKDIRAFQARAQELGRRRGAAVPARGRPDQPAAPHPGRPARRRAARPPLRPGRPGPVRHSDRRARRHLQAQHRRRPRLAGAGRRRNARQGRRRRRRLRPAGHGERPPRAARADVRRAA